MLCARYACLGRLAAVPRMILSWGSWPLLLALPRTIQSGASDKISRMLQSGWAAAPHACCAPVDLVRGIISLLSGCSSPGDGVYSCLCCPVASFRGTFSRLFLDFSLRAPFGFRPSALPPSSRSCFCCGGPSSLSLGLGAGVAWSPACFLFLRHFSCFAPLRMCSLAPSLLPVLCFVLSPLLLSLWDAFVSLVPTQRALRCLARLSLGCLFVLLRTLSRSCCALWGRRGCFLVGAPRQVRCSLAPPPVPWLFACVARDSGLRHLAAVVAWHLVLYRGFGRGRALLACLKAPRWCAAPCPVRSPSVRRSLVPSPWCLPLPRAFPSGFHWATARGTCRPAENRAHGASRWPAPKQGRSACSALYLLGGL